MKILFSMRHAGAVRNFNSTIRELAARGHAMHLSFGMRDKMDEGKLLFELTEAYPNITYTEAPRKTPLRFWLTLARAVRLTVDYVRYLEPEFKDTPKLSERARTRVPGVAVKLMEFVGRAALGRRLMTRALLFIERAIPADHWSIDQIRREDPDVVLVSPLVDIGSDQLDVLKAAKALGLPTALCVHSWDNLTTKGLIRIQPDRVFVWNEGQREEAVRMHGSRSEDVVVTGAPVYDQWFDRSPSTTRREFCAKVGLRPDQPFFLYLCSSPFIAPNEIDFIVEWVHAVRSAPDPRLREVGLLIRPHPQNLQPWQRFDSDHVENITIWPRGGGNPVDTKRKNDYYDSLYHSVAAVGINTSAQIEAGVVGRPVYTVRSTEHAATQEGTLHFNYLLSFGGGLVHDAGSFDEHVAQLATALDRTEADAEKLRRFVEAFVRPNGLTVAATPILADGIEAVGRIGKRPPPRATLGELAVRGVLYPVAIVVKIVNQLSRFARKRERQLRPLTAIGFLLRPLFAVLDAVLVWKPVRGFVKRYVVPRVLTQMMSLDAPSEETVAIPRVLHRLSASDKPIVVGPWLSEVGFEVLYWIPFLNWVKTYRPFDPERLIVVSRGGVADWYKGISSRYIDLFDFFTPDEFRRLNEQRITDGKQKQRNMTEFDRQILKLVQVSLETRDIEFLHPMYMYRLFYRFWKSQASVNLVESFSLFQPLPKVDASDVLATLPKDYVAVRFYFSDSFPDTDENRKFATSLVERLADSTDVVLLNPDMHLDDHWDLELGGNSNRVHRVAHLMEPRNNLAVQTKIISGARAYMGTYGGLSYVAPFYGVNSLALYSNPDGFSMHHLELALRVFAKLKQGSFTALDVRSLDLVGLAAGARQPSALSR
jgi:hypothetical protein